MAASQTDMEWSTPKLNCSMAVAKTNKNESVYMAKTTRRAAGVSTSKATEKGMPKPTPLDEGESVP